MTYAMMKQTRNWMPPVRQKRSQNALMVYTLGDEVLATGDALMRISSRTEGEFGSPAALVAAHCGMTMWVMCSNVRAYRGGCFARTMSRVGLSAATFSLMAFLVVPVFDPSAAASVGEKCCLSLFRGFFMRLPSSGCHT